MFADIYNQLTDLTAVLLTGCVIKLMDDYLDQEFDILGGKHSLAQRLGVGTIAYALLIFAVAGSLNWQFSAALLFAAYMTGMLHDFKTKYRLGLSGLQEIGIVFFLSCLLVGMNNTFTAIWILLFVQIVDDWLDRENDVLTGQPNFMRLLGVMEAWICGMLCLMAALYCNAGLSVLVMIAAPLVLWLLKQVDHA